MNNPKVSKSLTFTDTHRLTRIGGATRSQSGERVVVLPPTTLPPTVDELLSMFTENTDVGMDPLAGLLGEEDILEETILVQEEWLQQTTHSDQEITQVNSQAICLPMLFTRAPIQTDIDLVADFAWSFVYYRHLGTEEYVCEAWIQGSLCQVWRTQDGFIAQEVR